MNFKYKIMKKAISYELANFCFNYLKLKRDAVFYMYQAKIVNENPFLGGWNDSQFKILILVILILSWKLYY